MQNHQACIINWKLILVFRSNEDQNTLIEQSILFQTNLIVHSCFHHSENPAHISLKNRSMMGGGHGPLRNQPKFIFRYHSQPLDSICQA